MKPVVIELPWPDKRLSPNARLHWAEKAKAVSRARRDAFALALEAKARDATKNGVMGVSVLFEPPNNIRRDRDNLVASVKSYLDGIADCIRVDDSLWRTDFIFADNYPGGRVQVMVFGVPCAAQGLPVTEVRA